MGRTMALVYYKGGLIDEATVVGGPPPKVSEDIYADTALYLSHGRDDFQGGLCRVVAISVSTSAGKPTWFVEVAERPGHTLNWEILRERQNKLREEFGQRRGHADPDTDPESNDDSGWVPVTKRF